MKTISAIIAASILFSSAAYADVNIFNGPAPAGRGSAADAGYPGAIERGHSGAFTLGADGVPIIMPFVSDRTARKARPNFQPGPFHELGESDKVEWRR